MGFIDRNNCYYEGDMQFGDMEVEDRPSPMHRWIAGAWSLDADQVALQLKGERDRLLQEARLRMGPLRDAVELGVATPEESALLLQWKQYRIDLGRIEQQASYPITVAWPVMPQ